MVHQILTTWWCQRHGLATWHEYKYDVRATNLSKNHPHIYKNIFKPKRDKLEHPDIVVAWVWIEKVKHTNTRVWCDRENVLPDNKWNGTLSSDWYVVHNNMWPWTVKLPSSCRKIFEYTIMIIPRLCYRIYFKYICSSIPTKTVREGLEGHCNVTSELFRIL